MSRTSVLHWCGLQHPKVLFEIFTRHGVNLSRKSMGGSANVAGRPFQQRFYQLHRPLPAKSNDEGLDTLNSMETKVSQRQGVTSEEMASVVVFAAKLRNDLHARSRIALREHGLFLCYLLICPRRETRLRVCCVS